MSMHGHSFHKKDWAQAAGLAALAATGAGAAGIGPMAGLMGAGATAAAAPEAGLLAEGLGAGAAGELGATSSSIGAAGAAANPLSVTAGNLMSQYGPGLSKAGKFASLAKNAGLLSQQSAPAPSARPQQQQPVANTVAFPQASGGLDITDPKIKALLLALQQQQGNSQWQV